MPSRTQAVRLIRPPRAIRISPVIRRLKITPIHHFPRRHQPHIPLHLIPHRHHRTDGVVPINPHLMGAINPIATDRPTRATHGHLPTRSRQRNLLLRKDKGDRLDHRLVRRIRRRLPRGRRNLHSHAPLKSQKVTPIISRITHHHLSRRGHRRHGRSPVVGPRILIESRLTKHVETNRPPNL